MIIFTVNACQLVALVVRTKTAYAYLLQVLQDEISRVFRPFEPEYVSTDDEAASIGAVKDKF